MVTESGADPHRRFLAPSERDTTDGCPGRGARNDMEIRCADQSKLHGMPRFYRQATGGRTNNAMSFQSPTVPARGVLNSIDPIHPELVERRICYDAFSPFYDLPVVTFH